jgi:hypothetical protein
MADSTTTLDLLTVGQAGKETTANELFDAASPATLFGRRATTTTGLTWGFYGGDLEVDGALTAIANGTLTLAASATNYVEATRAGVVSSNTTGFTAGRIPLYEVVTGASTVTSYTDRRAPWRPGYVSHNAAVTVTTADVTLSAAQARARRIVVTGAMTAARNLVVPNDGEWIIDCQTTGGFALTVKTAGGSGVAIANAKRALVFADGTNVVRITPDT